MHSLISAYDLNERLMTAVHKGSYELSLRLLMDGAKATAVSATCGRTAVGAAALVGDSEILELLIQSCEEPDLGVFKKNRSNSIEMEIDTTPDGMDNLEWEDEFNGDCDNVETAPGDAMEEDISLYYYYAKTFERTGAIITNMNELYAEHNGLAHQDPHTIDALLMTPLHYAAACGHLDCIRILLEHAAHVDAVNSDGYTPLHVGAAYNEVTRILLKHGANTNLKTINTGETPLHLAIRNRCSAVANTILQTNANINETDDIDQTPLICAIASDLEDIAYSLIERGARINLQDKEGRTALYYAVLQNHVKVAARLLERGARRLTSHYLLHHCVRCNMPQMAELLISHGESLNVRKDGVTPIMFAIISLKADMLELLLQFSVAQSLQDKVAVDRLENELIVAVQYIDTLADFKPIARLLFAYSEERCMSTPAPASCYIPFCQTPLARAIMLHKLDIAEFLIKEGIGLSQICRDHVINNLRTLSVPGYPELARLLLHAGFKFPYTKAPFPSDWQPERQRFEENMRQLCNKPLNLQCLSRIVIRRHLNNNLLTSKEIRFKYHATKQESGLLRMIKELDIPKVLQIFLVEFDDTPTVMNKKFHVMSNPRTLQ